MKTGGIDLAAQAKDIAACVIEWRSKEARVVYLEHSHDDEECIEVLRQADKTGIDAPFGWPDRFVEATRAHRNLEAWPGRGSDSQREFRSHLSFRETDRFVMSLGTRSLSVSTDKIGVTAMRCALLLDRLAADGEPVDRAGAGRVVEVYPAAALARWGLISRVYKRKAGLKNLRKLVADLTDRVPWLKLSTHRKACETDDDVFDALVAALIARAAALGLTYLPPTELEGVARREGWIHLPEPASLPLLQGSRKASRLQKPHRRE